MDQQTRMGLNRTGIHMSPRDIQKMLDETAHVPYPEGDAGTLMRAHGTFIAEAGRIGSVPLPVTLRGAWESSKEMVVGNNPQVLFDKLGERLAFERSSVRLYDAVLTKCLAVPDSMPKNGEDLLRHFRNEETLHFQIIEEAMQALGADPTAQTPGADVCGIECAGLVQLVSDPRSAMSHCLHALLCAELIDHDGWELLIALTQKTGHDNLARRFSLVLQQENEHLIQMRALFERLTMKEALQ